MANFGPNVRYLLEADVTLITSQIQANIAQALAATSSNRGDNVVSMETPQPQNYFTYPTAIGYKSPTVFVIGDSVDFRQKEKNANHIASLDKVNVTVLIEDRRADFLTTKAYRYMCALHQVLDQANLVGYNNKVNLFVRVSRAENSDLYKKADLGKDQPEAVFRKEVVLRLDVEHFENF